MSVVKTCKGCEIEFMISTNFLLEFAMSSVESGELGGANAIAALQRLALSIVIGHKSAIAKLQTVGLRRLVRCSILCLGKLFQGPQESTEIHWWCLFSSLLT